MTALLLPFARRRVDELLVTPEEVPRGLACDCTCPGCGHPVMARQGTEKVWHFAHHKSPSCSSGYEKSVHELAKQLLRERKELLLPPLIAEVTARDAFGSTVQECESVFDARRVKLDGCRTSVKLEEVTADILGSLKEREILVEITVFHRLMPEKADRLLKTGITSLEIDLSRFKTAQATREKVEHALFEDSSNRRWLFHPKLAKAEAIARHRLEERLAEANQQYQAAIAKHKEQKDRERAALELKLPTPTRPRLPPSIGYLPFEIQTVSMDRETELVWRAGFPEGQDIRAAQTALQRRTGKSFMEVFRVTGQVSKRSQLQSVTPAQLATRWTEELEVEPQDILQFLLEANFLLRY